MTNNNITFTPDSIAAYAIAAYLAPSDALIDLLDADDDDYIADMITAELRDSDDRLHLTDDDSDDDAFFAAIADPRFRDLLLAAISRTRTMIA